MRHHPRAFTLIELLVVVAIIVSLIAILLPSLNQAVRVAHSAKCQSVLRQTSLANLSYAADFYNTYIYNTYGSATHNGRNYLKYWATDPNFVERLGMTTEQVCTAWHSPKPSNGGVRWPDAFDCPSDIQPNDMSGNDTWGHELGIGYSRGWQGHGKFYKLSTVVNPAGKFQFADGVHWWMDGKKADHRRYTAIGNIPNAGWGAPIPRHGPVNLSPVTPWYDGTAVNIAFYDAHTETVPLEETYFYTNPTGLTADNDANQRVWNPTY